MLRQIWAADLPSLAATMPATGAVCPRNSTIVAITNARVVELHCVRFSQPAWKIRLAEAVAKAIMLRLNVICCGLNLVPFRGQHCTAVETQVIRTASTALRLTIAVSRNGRLT